MLGSPMSTHRLPIEIDALARMKASVHYLPCRRFLPARFLRTFPFAIAVFRGFFIPRGSALFFRPEYWLISSVDARSFDFCLRFIPP